MRIFTKRTLRKYWNNHPETEQHLRTWYQTAVHADWNNPNELKATYGNASVIGEGLVVFNIKGNHYRLIVKIDYERKFIFVRFLGTHAEYDDLDFNNL